MNANDLPLRCQIESRRRRRRRRRCRRPRRRRRRSSRRLLKTRSLVNFSSFAKGLMRLTVSQEEILKCNILQYSLTRERRSEERRERWKRRRMA